ncbi:hypothetical protein FACS1894159_05260 [Bacteroidia bacterium]|nr:hypothetical protein FACS1894159_05260 [Bacteroidia bacterium]
MVMKRYIYGLAALSLVAASCVKTDLDETYGNGNSGPRFKYTIEDDWNATAFESSGETRASGMNNAMEQKVDNVWIFQFNGTAATSTLIAPPTYLSGLAVNSPPLADGGSTLQRIVVVANTNNPNYQWNATSDQTTYDELIKKYTTIATEADLYGSANLIMVGEAATLTSASTLNIPMKHVVARVELTLTCTAASNISVDAVQLCNVPTRLDLFTPMNTYPAPYPASGACTYVNYDPYNAPLPSGWTQVLYWYTPQNQQGTVTNTNVKLKNLYAPKQATYIKIHARNVAVTPNESVIYTFYPGENLTNNFDLKPNGNYQMTITINGKNDAVIDSRIDDRGVVSFQDKMANCYILNPPVADAVVNYRIYPTQVDLFWGERYESVPANVLGESTPWTADVLWMDEQDLVTTAGGANISLAKSTGTGVNDYFTVRVPRTAKTGSFVVYVYKTADGTKTPLWSWHLWVTDYNPDLSKLVASNTRFVYPVGGGDVHRYDGSYWKSNTFTAQYNAYNGGDMYKNSFMMDRNLGQRESYPVNAVSTISDNNKGYLYFQFGRKDPFPGQVNLYDLSGAIPYARAYLPSTPGMNDGDSGTGLVEGRYVQGGRTMNVGIADAVKQPLTFIYTTEYYDNWASNYDMPVGENNTAINPIGAGSNFCLWHDKNIPFEFSNFSGPMNWTVFGSKSIYDPCPYGWKIPPVNYPVLGFSYGQNAIAPDRGLDWTRDGKTGLRYWPRVNVNGTYPVDGRIYFPASGTRNEGSTAAMLNVNAHVNLYSATPWRYNGESNYYMPNVLLWAQSTSLNMSTGNGTGTYTSRASARTIRCISEQ